MKRLLFVMFSLIALVFIGCSKKESPTETGTAPSAPVLSSPANGATGVSASPTLSWNASSAATSYCLQVSDISDFSNIIANITGLTSTTKNVAGLYCLNNYYWRVSATNSYGTSGWSTIWNFTVKQPLILQLTTEPVYQANPAWSFDGAKIAYTQDPVSSPGMGDIWIMNSDGSGKYAVVQNSAWDERPCWSPDGNYLTFISNQSTWPGDVWKVQISSGTQTRLTSIGNLNYVSSANAWSPNGQKILFITNRITGVLDTTHIWIMNSDGSSQAALTSGNQVHDYGAAWSPDGNGIAYIHNGNIWVMNSDGFNQHQIITNAVGPLTYSPDGKKIAFARNNQLWMMNADGSAQVQITSGTAKYYAQAWSPDGKKIAVGSDAAGNSDIWLIIVTE